MTHPPHPRWGENLSADTHLFGDWLGGARTNMLASGIKPSLQFVTDSLGNPFGGAHQGVTAFNNLGLDFHLDMERLAGIPDDTAHVSASWASGRSLSYDYLHNVFNVQQDIAGSTYRLVDVYYQRTFFHEKVDLRFGRIAAGDEFLTSPIFSTFVQNGIDGNPAAILFNAPGMTTYPTATWGARIRTRPTSLTGGFYAMAGAFNGDETLGENSKHGVDFSMNGPVFAIAEAGYRVQQEASFSGLPGNYRVGVWYDDHRYSRFVPTALLEPGSTRRGDVGYYAMADQMVYRQRGDPASPQGLTPFVSVLITPDETISTMPYFVDAGLQYQGLIPGRENDLAGLAVVWGEFSQDLRRSQRATGLPAQDYETVLEWTYRIVVKPWIYFQPDFQYIFRPGATGRLGDALVLGAQVAISF